jgi:hypothetical protein
MTWLVPALYVALVIATALAWALARRKPEHRPIAYLWTVGLASEVALSALRPVLVQVRATLGDATWTGWPRVAAHIDQALFMAWPAALAATALVVFLGRKPWPVMACYAIIVAAVVALHPKARDGSLPRVYAAVQMTGLLVAVGSAAMWYLRSRQTRGRATTAQAVLMFILAVEVPSIAGAWRIGIFANWHLSQIAYLIMVVLQILLQGVFLWRSSRSSGLS